MKERSSIVPLSTDGHFLLAPYEVRYISEISPSSSELSKPTSIKHYSWSRKAHGNFLMPRQQLLSHFILRIWVERMIKQLVDRS